MNPSPNHERTADSENGEASPSAHRASAFAPTHWSVVLAAAADNSIAADTALAQLCEDYWYPLYAFVRRKGCSAHEAQDLTQDFFARLLEKKILKHADPAKGKFRTFLLASLQNFLHNQRVRDRAAKRGGGALTFSLDETMAEDRYQLEPADVLTPEKLFERRWALTMLEKVHAQLREECLASGKLDQFEVLQIYLSGEPKGGDYGESAARLGWTKVAVRVAIHRLRRRMGKLLQKEVSRTLANPEDPAELLDEIRSLLQALE